MIQPLNLTDQYLGQYLIGEELGRGEVAILYKAQQLLLQRPVVIKILLPHLIADTEFMQRFEKEVVVAAKIAHPNIVTIYEVAQQNGLVLIVMEYIEGQSLENLIVEKGTIPLKQALPILRQVADAIDYAHSQHFIHYHIKSANILVTPEGRALISNFGIAKVLEGPSVTCELTPTANTLGSPAYMSPEQLTGESIDYHSDLYSLGVVAYEMLSGQLPFTGPTSALRYVKVHTSPPDISDINPGLPPYIKRALYKMLAKEPSKRFVSACSFVDALEIGMGVESKEEKVKIVNFPINPLLAIALVAILVIGYAILTSVLPSPTGTDMVNQILFVSERDDNPEIYVMFEDGSNQYNLSNSPSSDYCPRWSPNALQVSMHAYPPGILAGEGDAQLFLIDIEKNTKVRLETAVMSAKFADWSPNGLEIVFSGAENDDWDLYVLDLESKHTRHLTQGKSDDYFPVWSPSGREIAFVRVLEREEREIYVVTVDGLEVKNLTNTPGWDGYPSWSPDGQKIIFSSRRTGNEEIYLMSSDGNDLKQITNNPAFDNTEPSFSPGGERVVFVSNRDGNKEIYMMNVDGSNIVRLTRNGSQDYNPHWR